MRADDEPAAYAEAEQQALTTTSSAKLAELASHWHFSVRAAVADNPHAGPDTLTLLGDDHLDYVRGQVAANPNTPPGVIDKISKGAKADQWIRRNAAGNPSAPATTLRRLASSVNTQYRGALAANPSSDSLVLARLAQRARTSPRLLLQIALHPNADEATLELVYKYASGMGYEDPRVVIAGRDGRTLEQLELIVDKDDSDEVRLVAGLNPAGTWQLVVTAVMKKARTAAEFNTLLGKGARMHKLVRNQGESKLLARACMQYGGQGTNPARNAELSLEVLNVWRALTTEQKNLVDQMWDMGKNPLDIVNLASDVLDQGSSERQIRLAGAVARTAKTRTRSQ